MKILLIDLSRYHLIVEIGPSCWACLRPISCETSIRPTYVRVPVMIHLYPRFELQIQGIVRLKIVYDRLLAHFPLVSHFTFYA